MELKEDLYFIFLTKTFFCESLKVVRWNHAVDMAKSVFKVIKKDIFSPEIRTLK